MSKHFVVIAMSIILAKICVAGEVRVVDESLHFPVPAIRIAEYAVAHMRLFERYQEQPALFDEHLAYNAVYVASVNDQGKQKYVFIGIPDKDPQRKGGYYSVYQFCDYSAQYEFLNAGLTIKNIQNIYHEFVASEGKAVPYTGMDICEMKDPARLEKKRGK